MSDLTLSSQTMGMSSTLTASITVSNTGQWAGSEVVQLYLRDLVGSTTRPVKELKGFEKIYLKAGESRVVNFTITPEMLKFYNYNLQFVAEPGEFEVMIGGNSRDLLTTKFKLQ